MSKMALMILVRRLTKKMIKKCKKCRFGKFDINRAECSLCIAELNKDIKKVEGKIGKDR